MMKKRQSKNIKERKFTYSIPNYSQLINKIIKVVTILPERKSEYKLRIPSQTDNLELIRDFVSKLASKVGFSEEDVGKIELAVDEACTNVIKHAYKKDVSKPIDIVIKIDFNKFTIVITDRGKGFDPSRLKMPNMKEYLAELRVGGLGIYLMRSLMDKVDYEIKPGVKNKVTMVKYFLSDDKLTKTATGT
jgi:serine/threonine-protein kinase RsbW